MLVVKSTPVESEHGRIDGATAGTCCTNFKVFWFRFLPHRFTTLFAGLLRLHGEDIARLQRLFDPVAITLLFIGFNDFIGSSSRGRSSFLVL